MKNFLSGYIENFVKLSATELCLLGKWVNFKFVPHKTYILNQYRNEIQIGTFELRSVSYFSGSNKKYDTGIIVQPLSNNADIMPGDIMVQDGIEVEFWEIANKLNDAAIGYLKNNPQEYEAIFYQRYDEYFVALLYEEGKQNIQSVRNNEVFLVNNFHLNVNFIAKRAYISDEIPLELKIQKDVVSLREFINTANPLRSFLLDAGEEYFYSVPPHRRKRKQSNVFEPALTLKAGSIRILLSPIRTDEFELFSVPEKPYIILFKALSFAESNNVKALNQLLGLRFYDIRKYLNHMLSMVRMFKENNMLQLILGGRETLSVGENSYRTIQEAISMLQDRTTVVQGKPYAIDTKRLWFKIIDDKTNVDWKFFYKSELSHQLVTSIDKTITVEGQTLSPEDSPKGIARLQAIINA